MITRVRPASCVEEEDDETYHSCWMEGTLEGRVGFVMECYVEYLQTQSDSDAD